MDFQLTHAFEVLERTPSTFRALLGGLPEAWTAPNEGPETFSAFDNVGHLVHLERTDWVPRARIILAQGAERRFSPVDRFAQLHESQGKSMAELLDEFARLRAGNLEVVRGWRPRTSGAGARGRAPGAGHRHPPAAAGHLGGARPGARGADGARDGQAVPRRGRARGARTCPCWTGRAAMCIRSTPRDGAVPQSS